MSPPGWTGGQYSLFRAALGTYVGVQLAELLPWSAEPFSGRGETPAGAAGLVLGVIPDVPTWIEMPAAIAALLVLGLALSILLALGLRDRIAAIALAVVWACLFGWNPLTANPSLPLVGWLLLAHACLPRAPYGSWERRGDPDPGGNWTFPTPIFAAGWVGLSVVYAYGGYAALVAPHAHTGVLRSGLLALPPGVLSFATSIALALELGFAPLALFSRLRPFLWFAMLGVQICLVLLVDFADVSVGVLFVHGFLFDPGWLKRVPSSRPEKVFYDGNCALCHGVVRFLLAEDRTGERFRFAPIQSETFRAAGGEPGADDTWALQTEDGRLLDRSAALLFLMRRLGGVWRALGLLARIVPERARDAVYNRVAATRTRVFGTTTDACPLLTPALRTRFLLD